MAKKKKENFSSRKKLFSSEFRWHLLLGLWALIIFLSSSIEGSGEHYYSIAVLVERKGAHIFEYFILMLLLYKALLFYELPRRTVYALVILIPFFYAITDEIHQLFVFGRDGKTTDVIIDLVGIILAFAVVRTYESLKS